MVSIAKWAITSLIIPFLTFLHLSIQLLYGSINIVIIPHCHFVLINFSTFVFFLDFHVRVFFRVRFDVSHCLFFIVRYTCARSIYIDILWMKKFCSTRLHYLTCFLMFNGWLSFQKLEITYLLFKFR